MPRQKRYQDRIASLGEEHKRFVKEDELETKDFDFGLFRRVQVEATQVLQIYRDGAFYKQLTPGPHFLWKLWHKWRLQVVDLRVMLLEDIAVEGRVKGPQIPDNAPGFQNVDLACDVIAVFQLSCKIANIGKFIGFEKPISVFYSSFYDMVNELIGELPYDQYGKWATTLRDEVKRRLQGGPNDPINLIGLKIEEVYVTDVFPNEEHDSNMVAMYRLVEQGRREQVEVQAHTNRDRVVYTSFAEKGNLVNIAPSILALQNSPIGEMLINSDAELRKLMIAAGLNPSVNIQTIPDRQNQLGPGPGSATVGGYLMPPQPNQNTGPQLPLSSGANHPYWVNSGTSPSGPIVPASGQLIPNNPIAPPNPQSGSFYQNPTAPLQPVVPSDPPVSPMRQEHELTALKDGGFLFTGRGQNTPSFDQNGQPIPGSAEWSLEVFSPVPAGGYLTIIFHCPMNYPMVPPTVQVKHPGGGGLRSVQPNTLATWNPARLLVEVAQELRADIAP